MIHKANKNIFLPIMDRLIEFLYSKFLVSDGISIDTRTIEKGNLFFAIRGDTFNGNKFASIASEKGASYVVIDEEQYQIDERTILVPNVLKALQELSAFHRKKFKIPVIGITGSNGKTTTKELVAQVLSEKYCVHATQGNLNNHIGVPLTLLGILPKTEVAIIEMGANHIGEIATLCKWARPTHGMITNIGHAHTKGFGGFDGVIRGKSELFDYLKKHNGIAFINEQDKVLNNMKKRFENPITFPNKDLSLLDVEDSRFLSLQLGKKQITTQLIGKYNFANIGAAVSVGRFFEISDRLILKTINKYESNNARSQIINVSTSTTIIHDAYNANPDSMLAALTTLSEQKGKKIAVLGDMNELENPHESHQTVIEKAQLLNIDEIMTTGKHMKLVFPQNHYENVLLLSKALQQKNLDNTTILLKASNSINLGKIIELIHIK